MPDHQLQKLKEVYTNLRDAETLTRGEFTRAFEAMLKIVTQFGNNLLEQSNGKMHEMTAHADQMEEKVSSALSELKTSTEASFEATRRRAIEAIDGLFNRMRVKERVEGALSEVTVKVGELERALGQVPTVEKLAEDAAKLIPPVTPEAIRDKLESIKGEDEKLDIDAIGHLREELNKLKKGTGGVQYVPTASSGGGVVKAYDISSQLNGVLKTFTLPAFWRIISVHASSFPSAFRETVDYTSDASAMTLTFTSEIDAGSTLDTDQTVIVVYAEP